MFSGRVYLAAATLMACLTSPLAAGPAPFFMGLGDLPGGLHSSNAYAVSADGSTVVGAGTSVSGIEAFRWTLATGMVGLGDLPGGKFQSGARGVSADGSIIVGTGADETGDVPFRWEGGVMAGLPRPPGSTLSARALGANGQVIVGGIDNGLTLEAYRLENGVITALGDLPGGAAYSGATAVSADGRVIVGVATSAASNTTPNTSFLWKDGVMQDLLVKNAAAISPEGAVVVGGKGSAYRWENGAITNLGFLPGTKPYSAAYGVSEFGRVIVGESAGEAFLWDAEHGMRPLQDVLTGMGFDMTGWYLRSANAVTPDGLTIVGYGYNPAGDAEAWIARVPEPSTLAFGGLGVWLLTRRRRA